MAQAHGHSPMAQPNGLGQANSVCQAIGLGQANGLAQAIAPGNWAGPCECLGPWAMGHRLWALGHEPRAECLLGYCPIPPILLAGSVGIEAERLDREAKRMIVQHRCHEIFDQLDVRRTREQYGLAKNWATPLFVWCLLN